MPLAPTRPPSVLRWSLPFFGRGVRASPCTNRADPRGGDPLKERTPFTAEVSLPAAPTCGHHEVARSTARAVGHAGSGRDGAPRTRMVTNGCFFDPVLWQIVTFLPYWYWCDESGYEPAARTAPPIDAARANPTAVALAASPMRIPRRAMRPRISCRTPRWLVHWTNRLAPVARGRAQGTDRFPRARFPLLHKRNPFSRGRAAPQTPEHDPVANSVSRPWLRLGEASVRAWHDLRIRLDSLRHRRILVSMRFALVIVAAGAFALGAAVVRGGESGDATAAQAPLSFASRSSSPK